MKKTKILLLLVALASGSSFWAYTAKSVEPANNLAMVGNCVSKGVVYAYYTRCDPGGQGCSGTSCPAPPGN